MTIAQATVIAKSLAGGDVDEEAKSTDPEDIEDMDSQKEFIVAYSGVNTANAVCIFKSFSQISYIRD